jgi:DNA repair protein RadC
MPIPIPAVEALRAHLGTDDAEGALRVVYLDANGRIVHVAPVAEGAHSADEFFARYLADLVSSLDSAAAVLLVMRSSGRPARIDRALWHAATARVALRSTQLLDLVVAGPDRYWSARAATR